MIVLDAIKRMLARSEVIVMEEKQSRIYNAWRQAYPGAPLKGGRYAERPPKPHQVSMEELFMRQKYEREQAAARQQQLIEESRNQGYR